MGIFTDNSISLQCLKLGIFSVEWSLTELYNLLGRSMMGEAIYGEHLRASREKFEENYSGSWEVGGGGSMCE